MNTVHTAIFLIVTSFFSSSLLGMEDYLACNPSIITEYKEAATHLKNPYIRKKMALKAYNSIFTLVNKCPDKLTKTRLLLIPLGKTNKNIAHYAAKLSFRENDTKEGRDQRSRINFEDLWTLIFDNEIPINEQDSKGNTPLHYLIYTKTPNLWNLNRIEFLIYFHANPVIKNQESKSPEDLLTETITNQEWLKTNYKHQKFAGIFISAVSNYR